MQRIGLLVYPFFMLCILPQTNAQSAYDHFLAMDFEAAQLILSASPSQDPYFDIYVENLNACAALLFFENEEQYQVASDNFSERIKRLASLENDPRKDFVKAEIRTQWAFVAGKYGNTWEAFWTLRKALMNIQDNIERYPEFELNDRTKGLLDITFAIVPKENQWIVNLFGMKGDFQKGIQSLERISLFDDHWGTEAQMMLKLINAYILEDEYEKRLNNTAVENYIEGLYLLKQHDPANAAKYFKTLSDDIPVRSYLLGESHFLQGEYQQAKTFYKSYIQSSLGSNYVKDAYLKLALS